MLFAEKILQIKALKKSLKKLKKSLDKLKNCCYNMIRALWESKLNKTKCESGGTGRRARLRGVWFHRTGSIPVSRTIFLPNCVMVARQTLTLFVWVQILVRQPKKEEPQEVWFFFFRFPNEKGFERSHRDLLWQIPKVCPSRANSNPSSDRRRWLWRCINWYMQYYLNGVIGVFAKKNAEVFSDRKKSNPSSDIEG